MRKHQSAFYFLTRPPRSVKPRKLGLTVFTELGKKFPDKPLNAEEAIEMANRDLEAGAHLVVVE